MTAAGVLLAAGLAVGSPVHAADEELIVNGGFEDGLQGWFANNGNAADGATLTLTDDASTGAQAVRVTDRTTTGSGPMQDLSGKLQAGETYTVTARVKYDDPASPATKQFFITMHYGGGSYTNLGTTTPARGEWGSINATFTIPADQNASTARIFVETPWTQDPQSAPDVHLMDFTVDDVSLVGSAPPPPASKTIEVVGKLPGDHNPLIGHKFGADGYGFAHDGRVYMYMTNDTQGYAPDPVTGVSRQINYGDINQITLISTTDMVNWVDHGEIPVAGPNGVAPYTGNSWAPGMASNVVDGEEKFFLYYANGGGSSNVIVGDSPFGPWSNERTSPLITSATPGAAGVSWLFDPAPLVDDDGRSYLYFGGGPASTAFPPAERYNNPKNLRVIELGDDMVSTQGTAAVVDAPVAFEAAQVFKRGDTYYLSYSSHFGGNDFGGNQTPLPGYPGGGQIGYMMSDDPMSWPKETYAGVMFPNQSQFFGAGTGGNNHQSVFEYEGKFYFTYHAPTLNKRITGDTTQGYRSPHIQELTFREDGTVNQVVGTYAGAEQVRDFDPYRTFEAETLGWSKGIATAKIADGSSEFGETAPNLAVTDIDDGDWTALSSVAFGDEGARSVTVGVKPLQDGGRIDVRAGGADGEILGTIPVDGPLGEWTQLTAELDAAVGTHDVFFTYAGPEGDLFELDSWSFEQAGAAPALDVTAVASVRCVAGKAAVTVQVVNEDEVPVAVRLDSDFASKSFAAVAPGASVAHTFTTRQGSVPDGEVTAAATATVDGEAVAADLRVPYSARSCQ
ncbi:family 43 glycosylhydrolase [Microbacterium sp. zg.Y1090]|uniref:family 43 glycosylhydrolase n=1 Tax=Microbacterium wangruii TaxID=3049073 RepID=UPI00214CCC24|nr:MULTISPECIES: family 43 glycosylhydrolase [unclassified Microbacterium]MCR2817778.1 family 43 glycosylhydrolase [Microbacterium sp. zg.Y1090]MDL5485578.1 family 43 glycosylhydrolase [Microbacterium sp. zg-Y1211]WIM28749.1 family 43 glycosylhydrolase [Microbacterium sp. zg-Y1090]